MTAPASSPDCRWMRLALDQAAHGVGFTRPNPPVGAVLVKAGRLLGAGFHARAGGPHAEIAALEACSRSPRGATLYVTLEPCSTAGRTPPCTERLIREGIARVVFGAIDPNPRHAGQGLDPLRAAGIAVVQGLCEAACNELITPFSHWIRTGRPWVTLKLATTLDGCLADRSGRSKWITGPAARACVQQWRRRRDAVMVGAGTVRADNPSLRCRVTPEPPTLRVIVAGMGALPANAKVLRDDAASRTIVATTRRTPAAVCDAWAARGAVVWRLPSRAGKLDLAALLRRLGAQDCTGVLCEGGARLAGALVKQALVDEYLFFIAPRVLADSEASPALEGRGFLLSRAPRLRFVETLPVGDDLCVRALPENPGPHCRG